MTLIEYFAQEQPVSTEIINGIYYKDIQEIVFGEDESRYAKIKVAHIGRNLWAFGWEIKDGEQKPVICRDCTPSVITKGKIDRLIYGMTKILQCRLKEVYHPTQLIMNLINEAIEEASAFCITDTPNNEKITI